MIFRLFLSSIFSILLFSHSLFAEIKPYLSAELDGLFSMGLRSQKGDVVISSDNEIFQGGYGSYRPIALRFSSESKFEVGFIWRGNGRLTGHSFFGIYQISYVDLLHESFNNRLIETYWRPKKIEESLDGYSEYLLPNLKRFLLHWKQLPIFDTLVSSKQLNNQMMASYNYSALNSLDISTSFAFSSFLPEEDLNEKKSDSFKRTEFYTVHFNIFLKPLLLIPKLNFEDELEVTLFLTYGFRSMPNAKISFADVNNLVQGFNRAFDHDANFFRGELGLFHSKNLEKLNIDTFLQYEHQLFIYAPRTSIERQSDNSFLLTTGDSVFKNIGKLSLFTSFNFFLKQDRYVGPKRLPTELVLNLGYSFSSRNSDVGLWEYNECSCTEDNRFLNSFYSLTTTPVAIADARLLDYFQHQMTTEIEYHFYKTVSFFVMYQFSFFDYSKLVQLARETNVSNISGSDDKEMKHVLKLGFRFFNSFIENVEPYFLFSRNVSGRLIPKENLDFLGVGIKFRYNLDSTLK